MTQKTTQNQKICLTTEEIENRLRQAGVQATIQRIAICQYVLCHADHPTAEEVHAWADENLAKISLATVYNTLNTLVGAGLLREFKFSHLDKVIYDNNLAEHAHFLDEKSGKLFDIPTENVKLGYRLSGGFQVTGYDLLLKGQYTKNNKS